MSDICVIVLCIGLGLTMVHGYPGGAPVARCADMQPSVGSHGAAQSGASPYTFSFGSNVMHYDSDDITITISGDTLRGLLCQVRDTNDNQIGSFSASDSFLQTLDCPGGTASGITHNNNARADQTDVSFTWTPPGSDMGELTLRCTVVKVTNTYWVGLEASQTLTYEEEDDDDDAATSVHGGLVVVLATAHFICMLLTA